MLSPSPALAAVPAPTDPVITAAAEMFVRDGWIDVRALAKQANIGRATLYRRYGDRDRLLGEALWRLADLAFTDIRARTRGRGVDGVVEAILRGLHASAALPPMRALLERDAETALRILTSKHGVLQRRFIASVEQLIREELGASTDIPTQTLAYAIVRLGESFYYRELITGEPADIDAAAVIIRKLLS